MSLKLYDHTGKEIFFDQVTEDLTKHHGPLKDKLAATDMDGTMVTNDIGVLAFLEKLGQPTFWTYSTERFNKLLLPEDYNNLLKRGAAGTNSELPPAECRKILILKEDIVKLYSAIHSHPDKEELNLENPLINEFARKMIMLDEQIIKFEDIFIQHFEGQLLMRTRFFADKNKEDISRLMKQISERDQNSPDSTTTLSAHETNIIEADQQTPLEEVPNLEYQRALQEISAIRNMLARIHFEHNGEIFIITTNIVDIAEGFVTNSSFKKIIHPQIVASNLRKVNGRYHPRIDGKPVFGIEKQKRLKDLEKRYKKNTIFAAGDSARNDWPMMRHALENNGIAAVVGSDYDRTRAKFHNAGCFENLSSLGSHINQRILYVIE